VSRPILQFISKRTFWISFVIYLILSYGLFIVWDFGGDLYQRNYLLLLGILELGSILGGVVFLRRNWPLGLGLLLGALCAAPAALMIAYVFILQ
jgi:hypothetical protein